MRKNRNIIAMIAMVIAVIMLVLFAPRIVNMQRSAHAAVTLYSTAQGFGETNFSHWSTGGIPSRSIPRLKLQAGTVLMDSSYATGGETLDLSASFPNGVLTCIFAPEGGRTFEYVHTSVSAPATGLIKAYDGDGGEVTAADDLSASVVEYLAIGW